MHVRQLAEIAGWLSTCSGRLDDDQLPGLSDGAMKYWAASRCRLQRWQAALKVFEDDLARPDPMHDPWFAIEVVIQEILVSELLTRVWTALLVQRDTARGCHEWQSVGYSVFIGHLELRNRSLRLVLHHRGAKQEVFDRADTMRRRLERWTDLLLSRLTNLEIGGQFSFDRHRVSDFAADRHLEDDGRRRQMESILQASLNADLRKDLSSCSANPDLNGDIVTGILECLSLDRFDSRTLPETVAQCHLLLQQQSASDMLDELADDADALNR